MFRELNPEANEYCVFKIFKSVDKWSVRANVVSCAIVVVRGIVNDFRISDTLFICISLYAGGMWSFSPLQEFLNNC